MLTTTDLAALSDAELDILAGLVRSERERRAILARTPDVVSQMLAAQTSVYLDARDLVGTYADPANPVTPEWRQPTGAHDAYPAGRRTIHNGTTWVSLVEGNTWEPGVSGWREEPVGGGPGAWVQPAGAHDVYAVDALVTHGGATWRSTVADNVWEPGVYGWVEVTA